MENLDYKLYYRYYFICLLILVSWTNTVNAPPILFRLAYVFAITLPLLYKVRLVPIVFTLFGCVTFNGFSFSFMPTDVSLYVLITSLLLLINIKQINWKENKIPRYLILLTALIIVINVLYNHDLDFVSWAFVALCLFSALLKYDDENYLNKYMHVCAIISLVLAFFFFFHGSEFIDYYADSGIERMGWTDPNYLSPIIGFGFLSSLFLIFTNPEPHKKDLIFGAATMLISVVTMLLLASRGGLLSLVVASIFYLGSSRLKMRNKLLILTILTIVISVLWSNGYFQLLQYRITAEGNLQTGSGRVGYWDIKLTNYLNEPFITQLFGMGYRKAMLLGSSYEIACHNDFIAFLVEYGIVGLSLYLVMLIKPIAAASKRRKETITLVLYLSVVGLTVEPISSGRLSFFFIYILILLMSRIKEESC